MPQYSRLFRSPYRLSHSVKMIQSTVENASQGQEFCEAITLAVLDPPPTRTDTCEGSTEYMHPAVEADGISFLTVFPPKLFSVK